MGGQWEIRGRPKGPKGTQGGARGGGRGATGVPWGSPNGYGTHLQKLTEQYMVAGVSPKILNAKHLVANLEVALDLARHWACGPANYIICI